MWRLMRSGIISILHRGSTENKTGPFRGVEIFQHRIDHNHKISIIKQSPKLHGKNSFKIQAEPKMKEKKIQPTTKNNVTLHFVYHLIYKRSLSFCSARWKRIRLSTALSRFPTNGNSHKSDCESLWNPIKKNTVTLTRTISSRVDKGIFFWEYSETCHDG